MDEKCGYWIVDGIEKCGETADFRIVTIPGNGLIGWVCGEHAEFLETELNND